jgi:hypothetical protein
MCIQVSSSKDRSAAKPRRSSLSPVSSLLASQKGRQKAAARAKSGAGKSSARKSTGYASEVCRYPTSTFRMIDIKGVRVPRGSLMDEG